MSSSPLQPALRLVATDESAARRLEDAMRTAIARENRSAAGPGLEPTDARWVLAAHTHSQLQGSALTPDRRDRVLRLATRLGIRPFDANVIIAIVQDHARRGIDLGAAMPTLSLVSPPPLTTPGGEWLRWLTAAAGALAGSGLLIWWLLG